VVREVTSLRAYAWCVGDLCMGWCRRGGREGCIVCGMRGVGRGSGGIVWYGCVCGSGCGG
jgi:hypothetical protein